MLAWERTPGTPAVAVWPARPVNVADCANRWHGSRHVEYAAPFASRATPPTVEPVTSADSSAGRAVTKTEPAPSAPAQAERISGQGALVATEAAAADQDQQGGQAAVPPAEVPTKVRRRPLAKLSAFRVTKPGWVNRPRWLPKPRGIALAAQAARFGRTEEAAARAFGRVTVLPTIFVASWLLTGLPLLLLGAFQPVPTLLISAPLATALSVNVLQRVPSRWPVDLPGQARDRAWMPWFGLLGTLLVAGGFLGWQLAKNSPSVIVTRTPGAYFQAGYWLAQHGSLPIPGSLAAFGGPHAGLHLSSIGFLAHGHSVVPAVLAGLPMLLASGFWTSGVGGGAVVMPVLGGLAILTFGGLVGRLAGRQWAPAGALALALTAPELYTSRDAFSEPGVQVLLFGGLCLLIDALTMSRSSRAVPAAASLPAATATVAGPAPEDSVARTLRLADAVIPAGSDETAPAGNEASDVTAPIPAVMAAKHTWLRTRSQRLLAWSKALSWRRLGTGVLAGLVPERMLAGLGGLAIGLTSLLSIGSLVYLLPVIAVTGAADGRRCFLSRACRRLRVRHRRHLRAHCTVGRLAGVDSHRDRR